MYNRNGKLLEPVPTRSRRGEARAAKLTDKAVFNTSSMWYRQMVALRDEVKVCKLGGHKHHWIPIAMAARFLGVEGSGDARRKKVDALFPQRCILLPPTAHLLMHYLIWRAAKDAYKYPMALAYEAMLQRYGDEVDTYTRRLKSFDPGGITPVPEFGRQSAKSSKSDLFEIPLSSSSIELLETSGQAVRACADAWKHHRGPARWPQFQSRFMRKWRAGRKALHRVRKQAAKTA